MKTKRRIKGRVITARCDTRVLSLLKQLSRQEDKSMSEIITESVLEYGQKRMIDEAFIAREKQLFGRYGGKSETYAEARKNFIDILNEKHRPR